MGIQVTKENELGSAAGRAFNPIERVGGIAPAGRRPACKHSQVEAESGRNEEKETP